MPVSIAPLTPSKSEPSDVIYARDFRDVIDGSIRDLTAGAGSGPSTRGRSCRGKIGNGWFAAFFLSR